MIAFYERTSPREFHTDDKKLFRLLKSIFELRVGGNAPGVARTRPKHKMEDNNALMYEDITLCTMKELKDIKALIDKVLRRTMPEGQQGPSCRPQQTPQTGSNATIRSDTAAAEAINSEKQS